MVGTGGSALAFSPKPAVRPFDYWEAEMSESVARLLVMVAGAYTLAGLLFAVPFAWRGAGALEAVAREATLGFRLLILPGAATLWPILLYRWWRAER